MSKSFALRVFSLFLVSIAQVSAQKTDYRWLTTINPEHITIIRDSWGVPHIFGKTDADAAYGLAWANAEDDFFTMQELIVAAKGMSGKMMGVEGAQRDFFNHAIGSKKVVEELFHTVPDDFLRYLEGYTQGANAFAAKFPEEVRVKGTFPVTPKDALAAYVFAMSAISGATGPVGKIVDGTYDGKNTEHPFGSNAFAFNSNKTADGSSMLCINPHQPMEGPFSWYEAHMVSDEGLNMHGAMFPGGTSIFLGNNENLGWAHTFNHLDLVDVFRLEMHPKKKLTYRFNDQWLKIEKRPIWLKVKLKGIVIPVKKMAYWSEFGATLKSKDGQFYGIRMGSNQKIGVGEQWFRMNKARNFTEFYDAVSMGNVSMFNIIYADRNDTVFFINNAIVPKRNPEFNYRGVVNSNSTYSMWTEFHPAEDLVQYIQPECGYVFNTNNIPTNATCVENQRDIKEWPDYFGFDKDMGDNNRAERFMELLSYTDRMTFDRMKDIKFDYSVKSCSRMYESIEHLVYMDPKKYPDISDLQETIVLWDGCADHHSLGAGVFLLVFQNVFDKLGLNDSDFKKEIEVSEEVYVEALRDARNHLNNHFGGRIVSLGELQRHVRGDVNLPLHGFGDALAANYNQPWQDGKFKPYVADSYTQFVQWIPGEKLPYMETLHPFGASTRPDSPHYTDQMEMYANQQTKQMTLDLEKIKQEAKRVYHPR
jgi:acyl-homoserine-lactone acylase